MHTKKTDDTLKRWRTAIKDRNFDCIRNLHVCETRPEHFDRALADGKPSRNVYLRRIRNHALGMEWLLKSVIPRRQHDANLIGRKIARLRYQKGWTQDTLVAKLQILQ